MIITGPIQNAMQLAKVEELAEDARAHGARFLCGGKRKAGPGYFYEPTVVVDVTDGLRLVDEEPFGPIAGLVRFKSVDEVLVRANSLPFGLASYAFTTSLKNAHQISRGLEAGMVSINHIGLALAETPFGGIKESGYGSEGGSETFDGYLTTKFVSQLN